MADRFIKKIPDNIMKSAQDCIKACREVQDNLNTYIDILNYKYIYVLSMKLHKASLNHS